MQTPNSDDRRRLVRRSSVSGPASGDNLLSDSGPVKRQKLVHHTPIDIDTPQNNKRQLDQDLVEELHLIERENEHLRQVLFGVNPITKKRRISGRNVRPSQNRHKPVIYGKKGYKSKRAEKYYDRKAVKVAKRVRFVKGFVRKGYGKGFYSRFGKPRRPARKENKH